MARQSNQRPAVRNGREEWPFEREGYSDMPQTAYAAAPPSNVAPASHSGRLEAFLGSVVAGCGAVWAAQVAAQAGFSPAALTLNSRPLELTAFGILLWLHGKWRKATQVR
jgi:hypothetical protein